MCGAGSISTGLWLCAGITLASTAKSLALHQFWMFGIRACLSGEIALRSALFRAAQRCASNSMVTSAVVQKGELLTLMTSDASRMSNCFMVPSFHWGAGTCGSDAAGLLSQPCVAPPDSRRRRAASSRCASRPSECLSAETTYKINKRIMSHRGCRDFLENFNSLCTSVRQDRLEDTGRYFPREKSEMTEQRRQQCLGIMGWAFSAFAPLFVSVTQHLPCMSMNSEEQRPRRLLHLRQSHGSMCCERASKMCRGQSPPCQRHWQA